MNEWFIEAWDFNRILSLEAQSPKPNSNIINHQEMRVGIVLIILIWYYMCS